MTFLERAWYQKRFYLAFLLPLSLLFWIVSGVRRVCYRTGLFASSHPNIPVIVVGNISVGGTGKTPLVIRLAQLLRQQGLHPGVLSRGYGGACKEHPKLVSKEDSASWVGDEPKLMALHLPCPIVIDANRQRGARFLKEQHGCDIILCDDGMQHYGLKRDMEIAVVDGERQLGNSWLLPAGPLRESSSRLNTVDFVIGNGKKVTMNSHVMTLSPGRLVNVKYPEKTCSKNDIHRSVIAAAGIGNPQRFFNLLQNLGIKIKEQKVFEDHHNFVQQDLPDDWVVMTEKDAVKCADFASSNWWYLPITAKLSPEFQTQFMNKITLLRRRYGI